MATAGNDIDYARLAAYIDADGCISISEHRPSDCNNYVAHHLNIGITNCDPRLILWLKSTFSCGTISWRKRGDKHRINYEWRVSDAVAERLLKSCLPYFVIKREQAEIGIAFRATILSAGDQVGVPRGVRLPHNIIAMRRTYKAQMSELKHKEMPLGVAE